MSAAVAIQQGGVPAGPDVEPKELPAGGKASADAIDPIITEADDGTPFDVEAARKKVVASQREREGSTGGTGDEDEETTKPETPKPKESEPKEEPEDEESKKARAELLDKDGKLSQDKLERAFAALTKQEKRLKKREGDFREQRKVLESERGQLEEKLKGFEREHTEFSAVREKAKTKPLEALKALGWSYEDLVKYVVADGKVPVEKLVKDMEESHKSELEKNRAELENVKQDIERSRTIASGTDYERKLRANVAELHPAYRYVSKYPVNEVQDEVLRIQVAHYEHNQKVRPSEHLTIDSKEILDMLENRQAEIVKRLGLEPGQAGAVTQKPETGKSKPLTNDATSVRANVPSAENDDDVPFDRDKALREVTRRYA